jgi:hypothetical protein
MFAFVLVLGFAWIGAATLSSRIADPLVLTPGGWYPKSCVRSIQWHRSCVDSTFFVMNDAPNFSIFLCLERNIFCNIGHTF